MQYSGRNIGPIRAFPSSWIDQENVTQQLKRFTNLDTFASLHVRDYRLLWLGQISTSMGQWMDQITRGYLIYDLTGSPFQTGLATFSRGLPLLFFGILAGAFADRSGRKLQLIVAQVVNACLNVMLATLVVTHNIQPWHIYASGFMAGTVQAFQQPARQTLVSDIVGNDRLMNALALNSTALNSSRVLGPSLAGAFIALVGTGGSYYIQGVMYAIATLWTIQMHVPERRYQQGRQREPFFQSIKGGFAYVSKTPDIRTLMMLALGPLTFGMSYSSLMPVIARSVLHGGASTQGLLLTCIGGGSLLGALVVASIKRTHGYGLPVVIGASCFALAVMGFSFSHWVWVCCATGFVIGIFSVTYQTQNQTLLQVLAPPYIRGRVMSIYLLNRATVPFGALLVGGLASAFGVGVALRIMSSIALAIIAFVVITRPRILTLKVGFNDLVVEEEEFGPGTPRPQPSDPPRDLASVDSP